LGAPVSKIVYLLSYDLIKLVLFANIVGWPIAYYALNQWLQNFAYRTTINPGIFILSAFLTLMISLGTLSFQTIRAALTNPVDSLRYE
jgi:putative ABC transport system permease protein